MAKRIVPKLTGIENDHIITDETDKAFLHALQNGLLLALKEKEYLTETQYRYAAERLKAQSSKLG